MQLKEITMTATAFKAKCLRVMDDLQARRIAKVTVTKRGTPVATFSAVVAVDDRPLHGAHKGSVWVDPSYDPSAPAVQPDDWNANRGILFTERR